MRALEGDDCLSDDHASSPKAFNHSSAKAPHVGRLERCLDLREVRWMDPTSHTANLSV